MTFNEKAFDYDERLGRIRRLVLSDLARAPDLTRAAAVAGLEPSYFSRYFKQRIGATYSAWIRSLRVRHAQRVLRHEDVRIGELARRVGYEDVRSLHRAFKDELGMTPGQYKRRHRPF